MFKNILHWLLVNNLSIKASPAACLNHHIQAAWHWLVQMGNFFIDTYVITFSRLHWKRFILMNVFYLWAFLLHMSTCFQWCCSLVIALANLVLGWCAFDAIPCCFLKYALGDRLAALSCMWLWLGAIAVSIECNFFGWYECFFWQNATKWSVLPHA